MIRLLHTSDWHLGAMLSGLSRDEDHTLFLDWLANTLVSRNIDALVIAGDVFDQAQPSAEAQRLYYNFLRRVAGTNVRHVSIVGGNHDSPTRLDAPRAVLQSIDVHVVGGLPADESRWHECIHPIAGARGGAEASLLAVPFVHEYRLGVRTAFEQPDAIAASFRERFGALYRSLCDTALARHSGAPLIATGHLSVTGADAQDAPKEVHLIGTIGGMSPEIFDSRIAYVALGHIHRSYSIKNRPIWYAGSPVALTTREASWPRRVMLVEIDGDSPARVEPLEVPSFRGLLALEGDVDTLCEQLRALDWDTPLPPYVTAKLRVDHYSPSFDDRVVSAAQTGASRGLRLVGVRQDRTRAPADLSNDALVEPLHALTPEEVFLRLCKVRGEIADEALLRAFREVLEQRDERS